MSAKTMPAAKRITAAPKAIDRKAADASRLKLIGFIRAHLDNLDVLVSDSGESFDANQLAAVQPYRNAIEETLMALAIISDRNPVGFSGSLDRGV